MLRILTSKHNIDSKCAIFVALENICTGTFVHLLCGELEETCSINIEEERGHQSLSSPSQARPADPSVSEGQHSSSGATQH